LTSPEDPQKTGRRLDRLIEAALYALLAGVLLSSHLRDGAAVALLVLLVADRLTNDASSRQLFPAGWGLPVLLYVAANLAAAVASPRRAEALGALAFYPISLVIFVGTVDVVRSGGFVRLARFVLAVVLAFGADTLWQVVSGASLLRGQPPVHGRFMGSLMHPTNISLLPILLPLGFGSLREESSAVRWLAALGALAVALAVAVSGTRAAWLGFLAFAVAAGPITGSRRLTISLTAVFAVVFVATAVLAPLSSPRRMLLLGRFGEEQRLVQWEGAAILFAQRPLLGWGPHTFHAICAARHRRRASVFARIDPEQAPYPHDLYLEAAAETGALGLGAFLLLVATSARALARAVRNSYRARAVATSLAIFLGIGVIDMSFVKDWVHLAFWLLLGVAAGLASQAIAEGEPESKPLLALG
jgi:O-antigen ligase